MKRSDGTQRENRNQVVVMEGKGRRLRCGAYTDDGRMKTSMADDMGPSTTAKMPATKHF